MSQERAHAADGARPGGHVGVGRGQSLWVFIGARLLRQARTSAALAGATLLGVGALGLVVGLAGGDMESGEVGLLVVFAVAGLGLLAVTRAWNLVGRRRAKGGDAPGR